MTKHPPLWAITATTMLWLAAGGAAWYGHWWPLVAMGIIGAVAGLIAVGAALALRGSANKIARTVDGPRTRPHTPSGPRARRRGH